MPEEGTVGPPQARAGCARARPAGDCWAGTRDQLFASGMAGGALDATHEVKVEAAIQALGTTP
jgi:hypothetical protein